MPIKKGKKKTSTSKGSKAPRAGGSKKGKKSKLSLSDKLLLKLEKGADKLQGDKHNYEHFVQVADMWLQQNGDKLIRLLETVDAQGEGVVSYDELKSALYDKQVPLDKVEIHLFCKLLDTDNCGDIMYLDFEEGLRAYMIRGIENKQSKVDYDDRDDDDDDDDEHSNTNGEVKLQLSQSAKQIKKCNFCKVGLWTPMAPEEKYIDLMMMLVTFADTMKQHPCHFNKTVHTRLTIYGVIQLIKTEVGIQSNTITVFRDKSRLPEAQLSEDMTLEDCGYDGRDWYNPLEHVLYYDYTPEFTQCPVLMCDHYFTDLKVS